MARRHTIKLEEDERATLHHRPRWKPIAQTVVNITVFAVAALLVTIEELWPLRIVLWPLMGLVLAGALQVAHDCFHNTYLNSKLGNRIAGMLWCAIILTNFSAVKYAHLVHHRNTRTEGDSEPRFQVSTISAYVRLLLLSATTLPRAAYRSARILGGFRRPPHLHTDQAYLDARVDSAAILLWLVVTGSLTVYAPSVMLLIYWIPLAFFPTMVIAIAMPEHHGCEEGPDILCSTRTTKSNWFVRMLIWNSNFHVEHHLFPAVPSCNLPSLHRKVHNQLQHNAPGYFRFHFGLLRDLVISRTTSTPSA